jgi:iron complex outermembrane receptor protein
VNGDADFWGIDASFSAALIEVLTADVGVTYLWGKDTSLDEPAIGVAPFKVRLGLRYEEPRSRYYVEGVVNLVGKQDRVSTSRGETATPGYVTGDIRGGVSVMNGVTLRAGVLNLWDTDYHNHLNAKNPFLGLPVPEPGRVAFLDLVWSF